MKCPERNHDKYDTDAMMLVMRQEGAEEKMLIVHTCQACGHKWRGKA